MEFNFERRWKESVAFSHHDGVKWFLARYATTLLQHMYQLSGYADEPQSTPGSLSRLDLCAD